MKSKYYAVCPYCGKVLLRCGMGSKIEVQCPRCKKDVCVEVTPGGVLMKEQKYEEDHTPVARVAEE